MGLVFISRFAAAIAVAWAIGAAMDFLKRRCDGGMRRRWTERSLMLASLTATFLLAFGLGA